jgi:hypothetical protein
MLKRPVDFSSMLDAMQSAWATGVGALHERYSGSVTAPPCLVAPA